MITTAKPATISYTGPMKRISVDGVSRVAVSHARLCIAALCLLCTVQVFAADEQPVGGGDSAQVAASVPETKAYDLANVRQNQLLPGHIADVEALKDRLKNTRAIGIFTKLAIRSDIMDLVTEIAMYRKQSLLPERMPQVRSSFEGLILKIMALLEGDPALSRDLYTNRELLWKNLLEVKA